MSTTTDAFFNGRIQVKQQRCGYRFSIDAIILAAQAGPRPTDRVVDLGSGCGIIPLILSYRHPDVTICGVEVQKELAEIARQNVRDNRMEGRIEILEQDMKRLTAAMVAGPVDLVASNPPYRKSHSGRLNPDPQKAIARHEIRATLADVLECAHRLLKMSGRFIAIYPAERLIDVVSQMRISGLEPKKLRMIHSELGGEARLFLVEGIRGAQPGLRVTPPLFIYSREGVYSQEMQKMFLP